MLCNADITIYHRVFDKETREDVWQRTYVPKVWWREDLKAAITTDGLKSSDVYKVRIPRLDITVAKDDIAVKGEVSIEVQSVKDFASLEHFKVTSVVRNAYGANKHIRIGGV